MLNNPEIFQPDAETAILSILLQNPAKIFELQSVKSGMFSSTPNQFLFSTIQELSAQTLIPDIGLIGDYLKSRNEDAKVGGRDYLNYLYKQTYDPNNLREFERIVVDSFKARSLIVLSASIPQNISTTKDINSVIDAIRRNLDSLTQAGGGEVTTNFENALKISWDELLVRVKNPGIRGITTGISGIDLATSGICKGDEWIVAGRPGMGKSSVFCNFALNQGKQGIPLLMFSLEMRRNPLIERMISIETEIPSTNIKLGILTQEHLDKISDAIKKIKQSPIFIDSNFSGDLNYVISTTRRYRALYGIELVYVDYVQLLAERTINATNELGQISRAFKLLANELGIGVVIGSQLNRLVEVRDDKHPILSDLRQSGNLEEDADVVLGLYRELVYNKKAHDPKLMEMLILKQRSGPVGMIPLNFIEEYTKLTDKYDDKQAKSKRPTVGT